MHKDKQTSYCNTLLDMSHLPVQDAYTCPKFVVIDVRANSRPGEYSRGQCKWHSG